MTGEHRTLLLSPYPGALLTAVTERLRPDMTLIVPNVQAGISVSRRLPAPVRTLTLTQAARSALRRAGWRLLRPGEREELLRSVLEVTPLEWLADVRHRASTHTALLGLLAELERAHLSPAELLRVAASARERDVAQIYRGYHAACEAQQVYGAAGTEHLAARLTSLDPCLAAVVGFSYLDAAQLALVNRFLAPGSLLTLPAGEGAAPRTAETAAALRAQGWAARTLSAGPVTAGDRATAGYLQGSAVSDLATAEAADIDAEVRQALRQVRDWLRDGVPPEAIAVIVRTENRYIDTLADVGREYQVPLLSGLQRPLLQSGLGRLVQAWVHAQAAGWRFGETRRLLTDPLLDWAWTLERAQALRGARPAGLDAWEPALRTLALPAQTTRGEARQALRRLLGEGGVYARCAADPELNRAVSLLHTRLRAGVDQDAPCAREEALSEISRILHAATQPALNTRSGVRVLNPLGALGRQFRRVLLLGLSEGLFPAPRADHPQIDAVTRQEWAAQGVILPDLISLASVEEALFLGCVATARETLIVTRPRRDADGTPLAPSPFWARLRPGTSLEKPRPGSKLEREVLRALRGDPAGRAAGVAIHRARRQRALTPHSGLVGGGLDVGARVWTLQELHTASLCRMRWFTEYALGVLDPSRVWTELRRSALDGALRASGHGQDAELRAAGAAMDERAANLRQTTGWHPGALWEIRRAELLADTRRALQHPDWAPGHARPVRGAHARRATVQAGHHTLTLRVRIDRIDDDQGAHRVTLYRPEPAGDDRSPGALLSADHQLALALQAAGAVSGRYLSLASGQASGTLRHVERGDDTSPAVQARQVIAGVMDALAAGDVRPMAPEARVCGACPARTVCRAGGAA